MAKSKLTVEERFWSKVDKSAGPSGCWPWTAGARSAFGYGGFYYEGDQRYSHRVAWELTYGKIQTDQGPYVLHRCDNPPCVNPAHLWLGTHADNSADKMRKGRHVWRPESLRAGLEKSGCHRGERNSRAKLTASQVAEIRALKLGPKATAAIYSVRPHTISDIRSGRRWPDIYQQKGRVTP